MGTKGAESFESTRCKIGVAFSQGQMYNMQDRYSIELNKIFLTTDPVDYMAVISGVGLDGDTASLFVASNFNELVREHIIKGRPFLKAVEEACIKLDEKLLRAAAGVDRTGRIFNDSGATMCAMWVQGGRIFCTNVGDCRVVASHNSVAVPLTKDHVPDDPLERGRIIKAGGQVYCNKINYKIPISRAFGLYTYKQCAYGSLQQIIIALPSVYEVGMDPKIDFFVLASGSVFEVLNSQQVVTFVLEQLRVRVSLQETAKGLIDWCATLWRNTKQVGHTGMGNLTCVLVTLNPAAFQCPPRSLVRAGGHGHSGVSRLTNSRVEHPVHPPQPFQRTSRLTNSSRASRPTGYHLPEQRTSRLTNSKASQPSGYQRISRLSNSRASRPSGYHLHEQRTSRLTNSRPSSSSPPVHHHEQRTSRLTNSSKASRPSRVSKVSRVSIVEHGPSGNSPHISKKL